MRYQRSALLASACAYALAMAAAAQAQETKPAQSATALEEVVVTGSFIRGTPEDAAAPVEVISFEELLDLGRPSNMDLIKNISETGGVAGENNRVNFYPIGAATINLRSIGSRFTTVVFNGRRFPEQFSVNTGRFNNVAWIPNAAVGSVETLKAGGGSVYGADAVAGVVNYITRKNFEGLELNGDYRYIEDSDGDYNADVLWGKKFDSSDFLLSVAYQHRSPLNTRDRSFGKRQFLENPASYTVNSNPGNYVFTMPTTIGGTGALGAINPSGRASALSPVVAARVFAGDLQMGSSGLLRDPNCAALGGVVSWSTTPTPVCNTNTAEAEELVSEADTFTVYFEHNWQIGGSVKLHSEAMFYDLDLPSIALASTFGNNPGAWPLAPAATPGAARSMQVVPGTASNAYLVPGYNPAVRDLMNSLRNANGTTAFSQGQIDTVVASGSVGLQNLVWKPFGVGGNPYPAGDIQQNHTRLWRISEALSGDLPEFLGTKLEWEVGLTYSYVDDIKEAQDILVDRLQNALNGFGGTNCTPVAGQPGLNGCQYFNPFSSAYPSNIYTGAVNPGYAAGLANDPALVQSLYVPIHLQRIYHHYVFDPIIRGDTGIKLPGGTIQMAFGGQFRMQTEETNLDDYSNRAINPCPTLGLVRADCTQTAAIGPLALVRNNTVLGAAASQYLEETREYPVAAVFMELQLPFMDNLVGNIAGRYEKFFSDVTDIDNDAFAPSLGLKYDPLDWLGIRGTVGQTFSQVNPPRKDPPIVTPSATSPTYGIGGPTQQYTNYSYPNVDIQPEEGTYFDLGLIFKAGNFNASVDYYNLSIDNYTRTMVTGNVLSAIAVPGEVGATAHLNCASELLTKPISALDNRPFAELGAGFVCDQNSTMAQMVGGRINFFGGNGQTNSGTLDTSGIDVSASYRFDNVAGGSLTTSIDVSQILTWELSDFVLSGVKVADGYDGVGYLNTGAGKTLQPVEEYRGTFSVTYRRGDHTLNIVARYLSALGNDSDNDYLINGSRNANMGDGSGFTTNGGSATAAVPVPGTCVVGPTIVTDLGNIPSGAGSGLYGGQGVNGGTGTTPTAINASGARGYCAGQNVLVNSGREVAAAINVDLIYRIDFASKTGVTLTINNVFGDEPEFQRGIVGYNSAYGSPLGRTFKLGVSQKF